ncbi:ABC-2 type transport system ATP-binding protein [Clostridium cavendishii DSM 21758]|uniref:ABC-2 type transport system ATP-binding protein n=1 Tax=Clostridium cavendishii DSM 21758 TaxID=1121302 RepID=A0A1M6J5J1_9CLOT|nr:ABC transporter ATP-binding protein [Clostridium cavendishii]SHJ41939.1 ABC-2 type transport system ATP-binding protein [Clostridium cavendishii DSM 21758]
MKVVNIEGLVKRFGDNIAVDNLDLVVEEGEIFGLLGPNGAGKSTTINMLTGVLKPNHGKITILGKESAGFSKEVKRQMGIVPQSIAVYMDLTAEENVKLFASLYGLKGEELKKAVEYALDFTGLLEHRKGKAKTFSGGMQRRLNIACAIAHKPKLVIMDEPTVGIDPQSRNHILEAVKRLNKEGCTVIYTTHYMEEVEEICSKIAIVDHGKVIAEGTKEELISLVTDIQSLNIKVDNLNKEILYDINNITGVVSVDYEDEESLLTINSKMEINNLNKIINYFADNKLKIKDIGFKSINLETVFLNLTGRKLRD